MKSLRDGGSDRGGRRSRSTGTKKNSRENAYSPPAYNRNIIRHRDRVREGERDTHYGASEKNSEYGYEPDRIEMKIKMRSASADAAREARERADAEIEFLKQQLAAAKSKKAYKEAEMKVLVDHKHRAHASHVSAPSAAPSYRHVKAKVKSHWKFSTGE
jgi:hypothetical protein